MRLGGYVTKPFADPASWVAEARRLGYRAAPCPINWETDEAVADELRIEAAHADLVISEVGAWSNPLSRKGDVRKEAIAFAQKQLDLAERIGARVCVNISGSRGEQWDGPHPDNFSSDTFALVVDTVREIIDAVKPQTAKYALEMMPWALPDSADSYLELLRAVDRPQMGVHFDPVNIVSSPRILYRNGAMIADFVARLGRHICNAHAKDIAIGGKLTVHLSEVIPGQGMLDYAAFLTALNGLSADLPLVVEHLEGEQQYAQACAHIRGVAKQLDIQV